MIFLKKEVESFTLMIKITFSLEIGGNCGKAFHGFAGDHYGFIEESPDSLWQCKG